MDRKKFIVTASLTAIGLSTFGTILKLPTGDFHGDCETTNDILGPFYRANAPIRTDLTSKELVGQRILLSGIVYKSDCKTPLKNAMVEIWHCDSEGNYDNDSDAFNQRARVITDDSGSYSFLTILPGKYLNGRLYRPAHIHYRVSEEKSKELISQIYFQGDPDIAKDPWASQKKAQLRILEVLQEENEGTMAVNFDIHLREK